MTTFEAATAGLESIDKNLDMIIAERDELRERTRWVPVAEKLPPADQDVRLFVDGNQWTGYWRKGSFHVYAPGGDVVGFDGVTHWMPLFEPPKD